MKKIRLRYVLSIVALVIGFAIIKVSISDVGIIRENIVSCLPEELFEMFDQEQAIICSNIQSHKSVLVAGVLLGGVLVVAGFIVALVGVIQALIRKTAYQTNLRIAESVFRAEK